jgi:hypothetical protein
VEISLSRREGCNWGSFDWINSATCYACPLSTTWFSTKKIALSYLSRRSGDINVTWRSILSVAYRWQKIVLATKFCFKVDYCLCIVVSNTYLIVFFVLLFFVLYTLSCHFLVVELESWVQNIHLLVYSSNHASVVHVWVEHSHCCKEHVSPNLDLYACHISNNRNRCHMYNILVL